MAKKKLDAIVEQIDEDEQEKESGSNSLDETSRNPLLSQSSAIASTGNL